MTQEQLQKANELTREIERLESFKKAFNNGYVVNYLKAETEKEPNWIYVKSGDELHALINEYLSRKIERLKAEFENL